LQIRLKEYFLKIRRLDFMSGKRSKIMRAKFEELTGFTAMQRESGMYKSNWRRFKRSRRIK